MISGKAGGHDFVLGICDCGTRLVDLRGLDPVIDINKPHIAHAGASTAWEINEINKLIEKMDQVAKTVLGWT